MNGVQVLRSISISFKPFRLTLLNSGAEYLLYMRKQCIPG